MSANLYVIEDYENDTDYRPKKTNPNKANFTYHQRGKTEVRCRFSEVRYLSSAFWLLSMAPMLAIGFDYNGIFVTRLSDCKFKIS